MDVVQVDKTKINNFEWKFKNYNLGYTSVKLFTVIMSKLLISMF